MDIREVDLNLLVVFDAMARHQSVNRTAEAIGLSQPATSAALARLRALFDDALFVRAGAQMEPTPRALQPSMKQEPNTSASSSFRSSKKTTGTFPKQPGFWVSNAAIFIER